MLFLGFAIVMGVLEYASVIRQRENSSHIATSEQASRTFPRNGSSRVIASFRDMKQSSFPIIMFSKWTPLRRAGMIHQDQERGTAKCRECRELMAVTMRQAAQRYLLFALFARAIFQVINFRILDTIIAQENALFSHRARPD
jgi:hypothetical protein